LTVNFLAAHSQKVPDRSSPNFQNW